MKKTTPILFMAALLLMNFTLSAPGLTNAERNLALDYMKETKNALEKSVKGLSPAQLTFKSTPDSWSIAECVEHIAISETNLFGMVQGTLKETANPARRSEIKVTAEAVYQAFADRTHKIKTQEAFVPTGKFGSPAGALQEFLTRRDATINYINATTDDLHDHFFTFQGNGLGTVDSYQLFFFIAGHTKRHTMQIEEVKQNPSFPKK